ncbi:alkyl/aryl-sulfatase [Lutimonas sp.]|uniref:alkyl/aryl-sulfatase n=1 Tax=Lutimonas sp. TaxID=1872403 RepID=UPI003D9B8EB9
MTKFISAAILIFLVACTQKQPENYEFTTGKKDASSHTSKKNRKLYKKYPFKDSISFKSATRGLIEVLPENGKVVLKDGTLVWDLKGYTDFIMQGSESPETVNPSLWRQSQLLMINGLFEVVPGVYQVRGQDLSNVTFVEGKKGVTVYDPLISAETAAKALELYRKHRGDRPVIAIVYSHSHIDHFAGVRGIVHQDDIDSGKVKIYAPSGFLDNAIKENVFAGNAMTRRSYYMYGNSLKPEAKGQVGAGLGITTSTGTVTLIPPTNEILKSGEVHVIDGLTYEFIMAPGSEAPSEMMWYIDEYKLISTAEDAVHTMHNLYTLRGAKTRDASLWPIYLNEVLKKWGTKGEVSIGMHHWPVWGQAELNDHIERQRDVYKFMHDQTLHYANLGYTINEINDLVEFPEALINNWGSHGYYGSKSHNVRAVYNYYLGYFDGNPAHLDPLSPEAVGKKYVEAIGGENKVVLLAQQAFDDGDYRWAAELLNHLVFSSPKNKKARLLQADILEQMGYQAESGPWRNFYLTGAKELRLGIEKNVTGGTSSVDMISNMSLDLLFGYMGIQLDAEKAKGKKITVNYVFPDIDQEYTIFLENSVLNYWSDYQDPDADATITVNKSDMNRIISGSLDAKTAMSNGVIKFEGSKLDYYELNKCLTDFSEFQWFNIVTP